MFDPQLSFWYNREYLIGIVHFRNGKKYDGIDGKRGNL